MKFKYAILFLLFISLMSATCSKKSQTYEQIRKQKKHQKKSDCPGLDCGHTGKKK